MGSARMGARKGMVISMRQIKALQIVLSLARKGYDLGIFDPNVDPNVTPKQYTDMKDALATVNAYLNSLLDKQNKEIVDKWYEPNMNQRRKRAYDPL